MGKRASRGWEQCWRTHIDMEHEDAYRNSIYPRKQKGIRGTLFFLKRVIKRGRCNWKWEVRIIENDCTVQHQGH